MDTELTRGSDSERTSEDILNPIVSEFQSSWVSDSDRLLESYLERVGEENRLVLWCRLLTIELHNRMELGEVPDLFEYLERFPDYAPDLERIFDSIFNTQGDASSPIARNDSFGESEPKDWTGRILGDYRIEERIGHGGMGTVYQAVHLYLRRRVAIKFVIPQRQGDQGAINRFLREMEAVGRLEHTNIVRCDDARFIDGIPLLVMELLQGRTFQQIVREDGPLSLSNACELICQAALGLEHAHQRGLVHRDVKPSNLMLTDSGIVKLLDLGLSSLAGGDNLIVPGWVKLEEDITRTGQALGTPDYMAPEQWVDASRVDKRADVYGLGGSLYFLLNGRPPSRFGLDGLAGPEQLQAEIESGSIPVELARTLTRALAKAREQRFSSCEEFRRELERFCGSPRKGQVHQVLPVMETQITNPEEVQNKKLASEDVQFSLFKPRVLEPGTWHPMVVYAHLSKLRTETGETSVDASRIIKEKAESLLGPLVDEMESTVLDSFQSIYREGMLTFIPVVEGIEFNPEQKSFRWIEDVHYEEFRLRIKSKTNPGQILRGRLSVFYQRIIVAEIPLKFEVSNTASRDEENFTTEWARKFRRIYASFAVEDYAIAAEFEKFARILGDDYHLLVDSIRDKRKDEWNEHLSSFINGADVFQLFWSSNALCSRRVEQELRYALSLNRPDYVRGVYWENPLPCDPQRDLPPNSIVMSFISGSPFRSSVASSSLETSISPRFRRSAQVLYCTESSFELEDFPCLYAVEDSGDALEIEKCEVPSDQFYRKLEVGSGSQESSTIFDSGSGQQKTIFCTRNSFYEVYKNSKHKLLLATFGCVLFLVGVYLGLFAFVFMAILVLFFTFLM